MAGKTSESTAKEPATQETAKVKVMQESTYKASELADNALHLFKTKPECVAAAMKAAGKETATVAEAKAIVEKFLKKEVK